MPKKIFILLPDGVGLRNFALSNFYQIGEQLGYNIVYWNNTSFDVEKTFGLPELKLTNHKTHPLTIIFTRARKRIELKLLDKKFNETVYNTYNFPQSYRLLKNAFKSLMVDFLVATKSSDKGLKFIRKSIKNLEQKYQKYEYCLNQLRTHQPDLVFCTNPRSTQAIAPILAAQYLQIPTVSFIFSWDNLPKATTLIEPDFYFVWSNYMKKELLKYCDYVASKQIFVTGTPQFESHFDASLIQSKSDFFKTHQLDPQKKYICFSGDDIVTSPLDQYYLEDLAKSVRTLNKNGQQLGIIFRKCTVDFSNRYQAVLKQYQDVIVDLPPLWKPIDGNWGNVMPLKEDFALLANICEHTEFVANVASSMVLDFAAHHKPCLFFNYEQPQLQKGIRDIGQNYKYIHFRSMPSAEAVLFVYHKEDLTNLVENILNQSISNVPDAKKWFQIVVGDHPTEACKNIWHRIHQILS